MSTTKKRCTINLTEADLKMLDTIQAETKETINGVLKKALFFYYMEAFQDKEPK